MATSGNERQLARVVAVVTVGLCLGMRGNPMISRQWRQEVSLLCSSCISVIHTSPPLLKMADGRRWWTNSTVGRSCMPSVV